ncbi:MAG TPA: RluA family pseudouridine synthase [Candidatus Gastranaerophilaceae bacterium]|nr:RluA family pseudouridine synthase [Candidatus Gastranaerophilaceae bacterium]
MKELYFTVEESDEGKRLDVFLSNVFDKISRAKIQELINNNKVSVNQNFKKNSYKLKINDKIFVQFEEQEQEIIICPQDIALDIVYEDENMLVVNKPSGMLTHPTSTEKENTLVNALLFKYGQNLSDINGEFRRGILHRLDRNTSGLLMVAKNNKAHEFLANQIKEKTALRKYLTIAQGNFNTDTGIINLPTSRHPKFPHKRAVVEEGKPSITEFSIIERFKGYTYLELTLKTGRTHQIRVHLSHIKHPIINDSLYGAAPFAVKTQEQVLQAYKLIFTKPFSCEIIELEIEPDEKIKKVLGYLRSKKL